MKIAIFTLIPESYTSKRLKAEAQKKGLVLQLIPYDSLDFEINKAQTKIIFKDKELERFDLVIFGTAGPRFAVQRDYLLSLALKQKSRVLNADSLQRFPNIDKINQHFLFQKAGVPFVKSKVFGEKERLISSDIKYPVIAKDKHGSKGMRVFKLENREEMKKLLANSEVSSLLIQPFLKSGEDIRVIVLGGKILGAMKRIAQPGQYLTNYSAGGRVEAYPIESDPEAVEISLRVAKIMSLDYVGVDLMKDDCGKWLVLEINRPCQFEGFEKATGLNVAGSMIDFLLKK